MNTLRQTAAHGGGGSLPPSLAPAAPLFTEARNRQAASPAVVNEPTLLSLIAQAEWEEAFWACCVEQAANRGRKTLAQKAKQDAMTAWLRAEVGATPKRRPRATPLEARDTLKARPIRQSVTRTGYALTNQESADCTASNGDRQAERDRDGRTDAGVCRATLEAIRAASTDGRERQHQCGEFCERLHAPNVGA